MGQAASVEMLIEDIAAELTARPYEVAQVAGGWMLRTKTQFAEAIKAAADLGPPALEFTEIFHRKVNKSLVIFLQRICGKDCKAMFHWARFCREGWIQQ